MRGIPSRERLPVVSLVKLLEVCTLGTLGVVLLLAYGRKSGKNDRFFFQNACFCIGVGRRVSFGKDVWCGEEALCSIFPSLFNLAMDRGYGSGHVGLGQGGRGLVSNLSKVS